MGFLTPIVLMVITIGLGTLRYVAASRRSRGGDLRVARKEEARRKHHFRGSLDMELDPLPRPAPPTTDGDLQG